MMATEVGRLGIRFNSIAPGVFPSEMVRHSVDIVNQPSFIVTHLIVWYIKFLDSKEG